MKDSLVSKAQKNEKKRQIGRKVSNLVAAMLGLSILVVVSICIGMFYNLIMGMLKDQCVSGTNMLAYELKNYTGPDDKTGLLDDLKKQTGCEFTIFYGDERAYTTILQDGKRAVGTKLSPNLTVTVLEQGKTYVGKAKILGTDHICSYVPTRDEEGKINGLIFSGISLAEASKRLNITIVLSGLVGLLLSLGCISFLLSYIKKSVSLPLSKLTIAAQTMERGDLGLKHKEELKIDIYSDDELGLLAQSFEKTIYRLKGYIGEISTILSAISEGNLSAMTTQDYVGDFTSIKKSLDDILLKLNKTMLQIVDSSYQVSNGSEQMSAGSQALSQGVVEQADAVEELEETIHEISRQVDQTAENTEQAIQKVKRVEKQILESNEKMQEMIHAMEEINISSSEIGKIIKTIEDIAFQTNILSLNAAVEAARAGTEGKGFAVVAEEVRSLAGKTAEASQSTTVLIERSISAVEHGTKIANETACQLQAVVSGANEVAKIINGIAKASHTQTDSISQVQGQLSHISSVVQANSSTAEESAATSQELREQAGLLKRLMDVFCLKTNIKE